MSLILEALRKSERERHQEALPESLATSQAFIRAQSKKSLPWPLIFCVLLLINLGLLGFFLLKGEREITLPGDPAERLTAGNDNRIIHGDDIPKAEAIGKSAVLAGSVSTNKGAQSSSDAHAHNNEITADNQPEDVATSVTLSTVRKTLAEQAPLTQPERPPYPQIKQVSQTETDESESIEPSEPPRPVSQDQAQSKLASTDKNVSEGAGQKQQETNAVKAVESKIPHINDLDNAFKKSLPRLVFNSHIFSDEAKGRRIMINDNYLREGDAFTGIKVVEITEYGVVLEKLNRQFLVPVVRNWSPES